EAERRQLQQWNQTQTAYPSDRCIHQLFEQQAEKTPQAIALVFGDQTLTYEALNARANQLARHLQPVTPDSPIGLWAERGLETIVAMLAILKAGGAYLPLDPGYPRDRLRFMAADAGLSRVVAAKAADLPDGCELVALDTEAVAQNSTANLPSTTAPDSLAYILYTSGSTGQPKGVCTPHRGVVRLVKDTNYADFDADQVFLQAASLSFDASTFEIWGVLLNGGRLILMPASPSLEDLAQAIARHDITTLWLTAGLFHLMVDERLGALRPVRQLLAGGDVLSGAHVRKALAELPHTRLINGYGPTENTTFTCCHPITAESLGASGENSPPIGRPIANTQIYVLDAELQPVPVGVPGELYVGGDGLARGYLNRPELTAERFVPNPFQNHPGLGAGVLYRTGDRVRYRPDGALEYLGRLDNQVKIRGFRIELGEIEAALLGHPDVEQAVVNSRIDEVGGKRLVTYVVLESGSAETSSTLRQFLSETLPDYMLPSAIVPLDALPLTANGKVDRNALSSLPLPAWNSTAQTIPQTLVEQTLSSIWRSVLRLETVGTQDNFFELGGDSILALQMVSRAAQMGISLSPRQIFQHQTIAALAAVAETTGDAPAETFELGEVPLTPIQQWFFAQELANPHHFNQAVFLELPEIDRDRLDRAIQAVVASHDAFRLRFTPTEAGWQQRLTETAAVEPVRWFDLSASPDQDQEVEALANELQASLNIETGPLMRVGGFDLGNRPSRLLVVVHHLIIDGLSWRILLDDLWLAYRENIQDSLSLPKTQSFKQWATWLQSAAEGCEAARPHWQSLPQPALPLEGSDEAVAKTRTTTLALQETQALLEATDGSQIEGLLLTALLRTSTRWTEKRSLLLTLENHGRHSEALGGQLNLSRTLGWFTCLHPLWLQLTGNDLGEQLAAVKTQLQQVPHRGLSYGLLRYGLAPSDADDEALAVQPQVSFNYLGQFDALPTGEFRLLETPGATSDKRNRRSHLIDINAGVRGGQLQVAWTYSHYHSAVVEPLAGQYLAELRSLIAHCQTASAQYSPEDFALADLDQAALEAVLGSVTFQGGQR
ncbi:MAG: amino acid adenylation domain-containing protein, partial [Cyanobacteria bacterium P01_A01_bin.135]